MIGYTKQLIGFATRPLLILTAVLAFSGFKRQAPAQSIRIQSWNSHHGLSLGGINFGGPLIVPVAPDSYGHHHHGYSGFGYSGFGYPGPAYNFGVPYQSFSFSFGSPYGYDPYPYQSGYFDYRSDYNRRLYDSYQRDLRRNLFDSNLGLNLGGVDPFGPGSYSYSPFDDRSYRPPVAQIEPFDGFGTSGPPPFGDGLQSTPPRNLPEALRASANRLSISLSRRRDDSDVWLDYLAPGRIISTIDRGLPVESISDLLKNFDGVVGNPELRLVAAADGFESTRRLLRQWLETAPATEPGSIVAPPPSQSEELAPTPEDVPAEAALAPKRRSV